MKPMEPMAFPRRVGLAVTCCALACVPPTGGSPLINAGRDVPLLPDGSPRPEPCPSDALAVMRALHLRPGDAARAEIDANQLEREPLTVYPGPVESIVMGPLGPLPVGTRFYGRIWTGKRSVVIRYYHAQVAGDEKIPICAVARTSAGQLVAKPGQFPGSAELEFSAAAIFIVEDFL